MCYLEEFNCALLFSVQIWKELKYFQMEIGFVFFLLRSLPGTDSG